MRTTVDPRPPPPTSTYQLHLTSTPIKVVYVSLHGWHARFAMPAMFGASAAEVC
jgi:hypothetical protein